MNCGGEDYFSRKITPVALSLRTPEAHGFNKLLANY